MVKEPENTEKEELDPIPADIDEVVDGWANNELEQDITESCDKDESEFEDWDEYMSACGEDYKNDKSQYFDEIVGEIENARSGSLIYRAMMVNWHSFYEKITKGDQDVGKYWSWDEKGAKVYEQTYAPNKPPKKLTEIVLRGEIDKNEPNIIDIEETVVTNLKYLNEEREIRLKDGVNILVKEICIPNKNQCYPVEKKLRVSDIEDC